MNLKASHYLDKEGEALGSMEAVVLILKLGLKSLIIIAVETLESMGVAARGITKLAECRHSKIMA